MFSSRTKWPLAPNRLAAALERHRDGGRELLDLTESNPTRCGFHYDPALLRTLANPAALDYHPHARGLISARQAVAAYYAQRGHSVEPGHIVLTASTSEAYSFLFRLLCDPGDEVLVAAPSYALFDFLAAIQDVRLLSYPLLYDHGWHFELHSLAAAVTPRSRALVVVNPNNPTGSFVDAHQMRELAALCRERGLALIADEVFLDFALDGHPRPSFVQTSEALTFTLSGISKICGLPQMKLSWLVASGPGELLSAALARLEVIADTYLSVNTPVQLALPEFLARRGPMQAQIQQRVAANLCELDRQFAQHSVCRRLQLEGGWYAVLRVPATRGDEDLAIALLDERSVLIHPGHFYDFPSDGYLVVSLITPDEVFREGIQRIGEFCDW